MLYCLIPKTIYREGAPRGLRVKRRMGTIARRQKLDIAQEFAYPTHTVFLRATHEESLRFRAPSNTFAVTCASRLSRRLPREGCVHDVSHPKFR